MPTAVRVIDQLVEMADYDGEGIVLPGTAHAAVPFGTTAQRSSTPPNGALRVNSTTGKLEFWNGSAWDASGELTTPAGSSGELQYNNAGAFGAVSGSGVAAGKIGINKSSSIGAQLHVVPVSTTTPALRLDTIANQTADPFQVYREDGTKYIWIQRNAGGIKPLQLFIETDSSGQSIPSIVVRRDNTSTTGFQVFGNGGDGNGMICHLRNQFGGRQYIGTGNSTPTVSWFNDPFTLKTVSFGTTSPALIAEGVPALSADIAQFNPSGVTAGTRARVTKDGEFSNTKGFSQSEAFGLGATVGSSSSAAFGYNANASGVRCVAIGELATAQGTGSVAIGRSCIAGNLSIAIGYVMQSTAANQCLIGLGDGSYINDVYFGSGVADGSTPSCTLNVTGAAGTDSAGPNLNLAGGKGRGTGVAGAIGFYGAPKGTTGTTLNTNKALLAIGVNGEVVSLADAAPVAAKICGVNSSADAAPGAVHITAGSAWASAVTNLNGADTLVYGGTKVGAGADGNVVLAHDGTAAKGNVISGALIRQVGEFTSMPGGTTQTITLGNGNHQTLDLSSTTGDTTVTLTVPASSSAGTLLIKQHGTTARDITWAASSGSIIWLGTEPMWNADATSSWRAVSWRFNGTDTFLESSGVSA